MEKGNIKKEAEAREILYFAILPQAAKKASV